MKYKKYSANITDRLSNFSIVGWLILVNIIFSLIGFLFFALGKIEYIALKPTNIVEGKYLWTIITHMFVHGGLFHLFINMFVLFSLGSLSEKIIGRKRFLWFYIISGIFAGLLSVFLPLLYGDTPLGERIFGSPEIFMVGASGAIFAIAGLFVMLLPRLKFMIIFLPFFSLPAYIMVPLVLIITWIASIAGDFPIGNVAHFGGFLAGLLYGYYLKTKYTKKVKLLRRMFK
ncbi:MAG: rhomboid family intramembrane serine protease [Nanoarchaeota archaeon]|nr:rhomboid family intramembrane serine protease [Nanoarchaeota archaeon]